MKRDPVRLIEVRHDAHAPRVFEGRDIGLVVHGCLAEVVDHHLSAPKTRVREADQREFEELPESVNGVIQGKGPVNMLHEEAFLLLDGIETYFVPHGRFAPLNPEGGVAEWEFLFDYAVKPCGSCGRREGG